MMKRKVTIEGRSYVFNLLFVLLNLTGLLFIVLGSHDAFSDSFLLFSFIGYTLLAISIVGIVIFQGKLMMSNFSRWIVGSIFIYSGIIKANDPIGFSLKLKEYFQDGALAYRIKELFNAPSFSFEFLQDYATFLAILICLLELILGVFVLIGQKVRWVSNGLLMLMLFFTALTWHTATCNPKEKFTDQNVYTSDNARARMIIKNPQDYNDVEVVSNTSDQIVLNEQSSTQCVTDCGCFGDAMKASIGRSLTPSESLWKDLILLYLVIWIVLAQKIIVPNSRKENLQFILASTLLFVMLSWLFSWYLPIFIALILILGSLWMLRVGGVALGNYFGSTLFISGFSLVFLLYVFLYEPVKDFRPFAVGNDLKEKMNDGIPGKKEINFELKDLRTGKIVLVAQKDYLSNSKYWDDKQFQFLRQTEIELVPATPPSIGMQFNPVLVMDRLSEADKKSAFINKILGFHRKTYNLYTNRNSGKDTLVDFNVENEKKFNNSNFSFKNKIVTWDQSIKEISIRDLITSEKQLVMLVAEELNDANWTRIQKYKEIFNYCQNEEIPFILVTRCEASEQKMFVKNYQWNVPIFQNFDDIGLKMIARSNPNMLIIQEGIVVAKYPFRSTPDLDYLKSKILK